MLVHHHPKKDLGKKIVIIIGAGFAGLNAAKALSKNPDVYVLLIDQRNHHLFQPLLYQVASAGLNVSDIAVPIRSQFTSGDNVEVHLGKVDSVDLENKTIKLNPLDEELGFDYLVLACGAQHSYFGHPEWEEFAPGLKNLEQATEIRRRILNSFELAENEVNKDKQEALLTFVIVGGGPTGVELAGAIADISRTVLINDFKRIDPSKATIILVEAGPKLLAAFTKELSDYTEEALKALGVHINKLSRVENINSDGVQIGSEFIPAKSVFWAAGVQASDMNFTPEVKKDRAGRIFVQSDLSLSGFPQIFVIGDMASIEIQPGQTVPALAPAAIQQGKHVAKVINASMKNQTRSPFIYFDKGLMATIGKHKAVLQFKGIESTGFIAWMSWLFIHIFYLIGFKNKFSVFLHWGWSYVFSKRGARLILNKEWKLK